MKTEPNKSNRKIIDSLLKKWIIVLEISEKEAQKKCSAYENKFGSYIFIQNENKPLIMCKEGYTEQQKIQRELCKYLPKIKHLICSKPAIDGEWRINVYSELFFSHYQIVVQKIKEYVKNTHNV